eukprot:m.354781 g.354781  ORF g.354781 m.354781 type:complete len:378 (+) comp17102_c0_seq1:111-1244(+)
MRSFGSFRTQLRTAVNQVIRGARHVRSAGRPLSTKAARCAPETAVESVASPSDMLKDKFNRTHTYLRISLTERCNLRCTYCMPEEGVPLTPNDQLLSRDEMSRIASVFINHGVDKIRLTGGEPTVYPELIPFIEDLASHSTVKSIGITTNGLVLKKKLPDLKQAGLTHINVSLDTLLEPKFNFISRRKGLHRVLASIDHAIELGFTPKVNVVLLRGVNDDELLDFVELTKDKPIDLRFIEYMPFDGNRWNMDRFVSYDEMLERIGEKYALTRLDDGPNDTSKAWWVPDHAGTLGFITSMSQNFCSSCNRVRMTADGNLKVCLFGNTEVNLKDVLRTGATDQELIEVISGAILNKKKQHAGMFELAKRKNRPMILIGG